MKLSSNSISMLIFTALATAVFVLMALRPAVEGSAMNLGTPVNITKAAETSVTEAVTTSVSTAVTATTEAVTEGVTAVTETVSSTASDLTTAVKEVVNEAVNEEPVVTEPSSENTETTTTN